MTQLIPVTLVMENDGSTHEVSYDWKHGVWRNTTASRHVGPDTMTHLVLPNIKTVKFGNSEMTDGDWRFLGCPLVLTQAEIEVLLRAAKTARGLEMRRYGK